MISVTQLRNGVNFEVDGQAWRVLQYKHTHLSRGSGTIKVKCRNLRNGQVLTKTFKSGDKVREASVAKKSVQFLYTQDSEYIFMNQDSYEQIELKGKIIGADVVYLQEGMLVDMLFLDDEPIGLSLPPKMEFVVAEAAPGEKGDSASNMYKDAMLENGLKIRVPLFVDAGEKVRVDTRDGSYIERA